MNTRTQIVIAVFGISGVGKTTLIRAATAESSITVLHLQASKLIKDAKQRQVSSDSLRRATADQIQTNQGVLISEFRRQVSSSIASVILFDGHSIIDNDNDNDTELVPIPVGVIRGLRPSRLIFVEESSDVIQRHRQADRERYRPKRSQQRLADLQRRSLDICISYGNVLGIPLNMLRSTDHDKLRALIVQGY